MCRRPDGWATTAERRPADFATIPRAARNGSTASRRGRAGEDSKHHRAAARVDPDRGVVTGCRGQGLRRERLHHSCRNRSWWSAGTQGCDRHRLLRSPAGAGQSAGRVAPGDDRRRRRAPADQSAGRGGAGVLAFWACYAPKMPKSAGHRDQRSPLRETGGVLLSQGFSPQVPSALTGLTSVFGMGTGVTLSLWPPEIGCQGVLSHTRTPEQARASIQALGRLVPVG